jgi:hypothetical protein
MFQMTSTIKVQGIKNEIKPNAIKWKRSVTDYSDTAVIKLPAIAMLKKNADEYARVETGLKFQEGLQVEIACGYNGTNMKRFQGFIRRISPTVPLEIECEGYSYELRKKQGFNKSYKAGTKLKTLLNDLLHGTSIKLSKSIPDITIQSPFSFSQKKGTDVLDWLKEKMLMTVYFNFDELYVGPHYTELKKTVKLQMGWNVIQDNELKFKEKKELAEVRIQVSQKQKNGKKESTEHDSKFGNTKQIKLGIRLDEATRKMIAEDQKKRLVNRGYEGAVTTFLNPYAEPAMAAQIDDKKYPDRTGKYFIEAVEGDYSSGGGRQKIKIGANL